MKATWKELLVITAAVVLAPVAGFAHDKADGGAAGGDKPKIERKFDGGKGDWEEMKKLSPEEREKFTQERKAKWDALSSDEKVKMIEERRAERRKQRDAEWNAMSNDEKIKHVEEKMKRMEEHHKRGGKGPHGGPHGDDGPPPPPPGEGGPGGGE